MTMKIDLKNMNPGVTFPFDESAPDDGHIILRVLTGKKLREINKVCRIKRTEVKGNPPARFEFLDFKKGGEEKEFELTWNYCIVGWYKVIDSDGKPIDCTPENKVMLMEESPDFSRFAMQCIDKIRVTEEEHEKDLEGN